jgi:hypothetical protein
VGLCGPTKRETTSGSMSEGEQPKRAACERCGRPPRACYCTSLPSREVRTAVTRVLVLQHEREQRRRQAISSVPVLRRVLEQDVDIVRVAEHCDCGVGADARLDDLLYAEDAGFDAALVLFPDAQAKLLDAELLDELGLVADREQAQSTVGAVDGHRLLLVVIDGTWTEAKKIAFHNRDHWAKAAESWRRRGKLFEYVCLGADTSTERVAEAPSLFQTSGSIYGDLRR